MNLQAMDFSKPFAVLVYYEYGNTVFTGFDPKYGMTQKVFPHSPESKFKKHYSLLGYHYRRRILKRKRL